MKKKVWIFLIAVFIFIVFSFVFINKLTITNHGKLDKMFAVVLKTQRYFNPDSIKDKSVLEIRKSLEKEAMRWSGKTIAFPNIKNLNIAAASNNIPVRIYTPKTGKHLPIIIYSHGGSWIAGSIDTHDNVCRKLSRNTEAIVISVNYRLAPENPFPAALGDVYNVLRWTYKNAESINGDAKHIAVAGDSAGGNLSAAVCLMARDNNNLYVDCQVLIYPATDIFYLNTESWSFFQDKLNVSKNDMEKYISFYVPEKEVRKNPYASPLLADNLKNLPDTLVVTAEIDPLRDEGTAYVNKLRTAGVEAEHIQYKGVTHGFINMDRITNKADQAINEVSKYVQKEFKK